MRRYSLFVLPTPARHYRGACRPRRRILVVEVGPNDRVKMGCVG